MKSIAIMTAVLVALSNGYGVAIGDRLVRENVTARVDGLSVTERIGQMDESSGAGVQVARVDGASSVSSYLWGGDLVLSRVWTGALWGGAETGTISFLRFTPLEDIAYEIRGGYAGYLDGGARAYFSTAWLGGPGLLSENLEIAEDGAWAYAFNFSGILAAGLEVELQHYASLWSPQDVLDESVFPGRALGFGFWELKARAVPESGALGSLGMLGIGVLGIALFRWRKSALAAVAALAIGAGNMNAGDYEEQQRRAEEFDRRQAQWQAQFDRDCRSKSKPRSKAK